MLSYERRTGERMTYEKLSDRTGIAVDTLSAIGTKSGYNATIHKVAMICQVLGVEISDLVQRRPETRLQEYEPNAAGETRVEESSEPSAVSPGTRFSGNQASQPPS